MDAFTFIIILCIFKDVLFIEKWQKIIFDQLKIPDH